MNRARRIGLAVIVLAIAAAAALEGPALLRVAFPPPDTDIHVAGDVQTPVVTIGGPAVVNPVPDFTVGISGATGASARAASASRSGASSSRQPVVSGLLIAVDVAEGSRVTTGQVVARLDARLLSLGVTAARTAYAKTRADADVLADTLDTLASSRAKLATARTKLTRALAQATAGRAALAAQLAQLRAAIHAGPPPTPPAVPPTGTPSPTATPGPPFPPGPPRGPTPQQLIARLKIALAKLDAGILQMRAGLAKLASGAAQLADARTQVRNGRDMLNVLADGRRVSIRIAEARLGAAAIITDVSGTVSFARPAGTVVMVGTPIVRIVPDGPSRVDTFLTGEQLARVHLGGDAYVGFDSHAGAPLHGRITRIGETAQLPPTSFPTGVMHMTRAMLVTITLDEPGIAPAGTPVDVTLPTD